MITASVWTILLERSIKLGSSNGQCVCGCPASKTFLRASIESPTNKLYSLDNYKSQIGRAHV